MRHKFYYCQVYDSELIDILEKNKIQYQLTGGSITPLMMKFSIWDDSSTAMDVINQIAKRVKNNPIITPEYTDSEIESSEWLWITPKKQWVDISNPQEAYISTCKYTDLIGKSRIKHRQQKDLFAITKEPSLKSRISFWSESSGFSELFTDYRVKELVEKNRLSGIEFKNVILKHGCYSKILYQITSNMIIGHDCIDTGHGEKITSCNICGKKQFIINENYQLHIDFSKIDKQSDMYVTERMFGDGISYPLYIISQRFYQLLKQAKFANGITVSPVINMVNSE